MAEETQPTLVIDFGDGVSGEFRAHRYANQFLLVRHVDQIFDSGYQAVQAVTVLVLDQVLPEERARLEDFLLENGRRDDYSQRLYDALDGCWKGETSLPLEPSSVSSGTSLSPETGQPSRDDSSSPATSGEPARRNLEVA